MIKIKLYSQKYPGMFALIDDEDFDLVKKYRWNPLWNPRSQTFYARGRIPGKGASQRSMIFMHRLILNAKKNEQTDHKNQNGLDNRRKINLRICTRSQNKINGKNYRGGSSKFKGVCWDKRYQKWHTQIKLNKKGFHLGYFDNEIIAAETYDKKAIELHGEYALTNKMLGLI